MYIEFLFIYTEDTYRIPQINYYTNYIKKLSIKIKSIAVLKIIFESVL